MSDRVKIEHLFLKLACLFGFIYIFITPPFQVADEDSHFKKAYLVSNFNFLPTQLNGESGSYFPKAILDFEQSNRYMINDVTQKYSFSKLQSSETPQKSLGERVFALYSTSNTNPIMYIPQAISILAFKAFFAVFDSDYITPSLYLYAGRIGNLLFFVTCIFYALKMIPFYKRLLLMIGLMPMTLTLASSMNYDAMVIGVSILLTSILLYYAYDDSVKVISRNKIILLMCFSIILIELKLVYYPLLLLYFLIPASKFSSKKIQLGGFAAVILCGVMSHVLWMIITSIRLSAAGDSTGINVHNQLQFIITHPFQYLEVLLRTFKDLRFFYLNSFIGNLGWLDTNFPVLFILIYFVFLCVLAVLDTNKFILPKLRDKFIVLLVSAAIIVLVETSLYLIWTSIPEIGGIGYPIVSGVQGRYFIPCALLCLFIFYSNKIESYSFFGSLKNRVTNIVPVMSLYTCILTSVILLMRYWIP